MTGAADTHAEPGAGSAPTHADTWVRSLLGAFLLWHFVALLPFAAELFSDAGMLPAAASPFAGLPNPLLLWPTAAAATIAVALGALAGLCLALGFRDRWAALVAYLVWVALYTRNPFIANPSLPCIGFMLLSHASLGRVARTPAWIVMALAYSYSGVTKLAAPSWVDGSAIAAVLANPLARDTALRTWLLAWPPQLLASVSYGTLGLEILTAPLALVARLRPYLWLALVLMHVTILVLVDFADLTCGMLVLHAYTFDPRWLTLSPGRAPPQRRPRPLPPAAPRQRTALSNWGRTSATIRYNETFVGFIPRY